MCDPERSVPSRLYGAPREYSNRETRWRCSVNDEERSHARRLRSINNLRMCKLSVAVLWDFEFDSLISLTREWEEEGGREREREEAGVSRIIRFLSGLWTFIFYSFFFFYARGVYINCIRTIRFFAKVSRARIAVARSRFSTTITFEVRANAREREIERKSTLLFAALVASNDKTNFTKCDSRIQSARLREDSDMLLQIFEIYNVQTWNHPL